MAENWPVGSACHRGMLGAHNQGTTLAGMVKWETKIQDAETPALVLLLNLPLDNDAAQLVQYRSGFC